MKKESRGRHTGIMKAENTKIWNRALATACAAVMGVNIILVSLPVQAVEGDSQTQVQDVTQGDRKNENTELPSDNANNLQARSTISIGEESLVIEQEEGGGYPEQTLTVAPADAAATYTWKSSDDTVATVNAGTENGTATVTAVSPGNTTIMVTDNTGASATREIIVKQLNYDSITVSAQKDGASISEARTTDTGITLVAKGTPDAAYCVHNEISWTSNDGAVLVDLSSGAVTVKGWEGDDDKEITFTAAAEGVSGTTAVTFRKPEAPIQLQDLELAYGDSGKQLTALVNGAPVTGDTAKLTFEQMDGQDVATVSAVGTVSVLKTGTFTVKVAYADAYYKTTEFQDTVTVERKIIYPRVAEGAAVIEKTSDGTQSLTAENQQQLQGTVEFEGVLPGDTIAPDYYFYDGLDGIKYDYPDPREGNTITVSTGQITLTDDRYALPDSYSFSLKAKINAIQEQDALLNMTAENNEITKHGVTFHAGVLGTDGQYWYTADGVPVTGEVYAQDNSLAVENGFLRVASGEIIYIKDANDNTYYQYSVQYQKDDSAPTVSLVDVEIAGESVNGMIFDKEAVYTISVQDQGSGVQQQDILYGISTTEQEEDITDWLAPNWEDSSTTQFKVAVPANGYLFVRATDVVGNEAIDGCRALVLEADEPKVTVALDGQESQPAQETVYAQSHTIAVTAWDAEQEGTSPYTYSGIKSVTLTLEDQEGQSVYSQKEENSVPGSMGDLPDARQLVINPITIQNMQGTDIALNGTYTLTVSVVDNCGNQNTQKYTLNFDNTAPEYSLSMADTRESGGNYYAKSDTCGLKLTMSDRQLAYGMDYSIKVNGNEVSAGTTTTGEVVVSAEDISKAVAEDGTVIVTATVTDQSGNVQTTYTRAEGMKAGDTAEEAAFVLDRTAPVVAAVETVKADTPLTGKPAYDDVYYYSEENITVQVTIADDYIGAEDWAATVSWNGATENGTVTSSAEGLAIAFDLSEEGMYSNMTFTGKDYAGNEVVLASELSFDPADEVTLEGNTVTMNHSKVVDHTAPVAVITYTELASSHVYQESGQTEDQKTAYYNTDVTAEVQVTDQYGDISVALDDTKLAFGFSQDPVAGEADNKGMQVTKQQTWNSDGQNYVEVYGTDRAGNPLTVVEKFQYTDNAEAFENEVTGCSQDNAYRSRFTLVVDTTAPEFVMAITPDESVANQDKDSADNRYYFNGGFEAAVTVTETNFDPERVIVEKVFQEDSNQSDSSDVMLDFQNFTEVKWGQDAYRDVVESTQDGIYRYRVYGTDKAGNPLIPADSDNENLEATIAVPETDGESTADVSVHVVVDTKAPELTVQVLEKDQTAPFYKAVLSAGNTYAPQINQPYRSVTEASAVVSGTDYTPFTLAYSFESTNPDANNQGMAYSRSDYNKDGAQTIFNGQQTVRLTSLTATDKAGNTAVASKASGAVSNWLYLDVQAPQYDELAPNVTMQVSGTTNGKAVGSVYGPDENDLYTSNVTVRVHIQDLNQGIRSSGLYKTYYKVEVNGEDWTRRNLVEISASEPIAGTTKTIENGEITYGTTGNEGDVNQDEVLTYDDEITFTFKASDFNYNDIKITVWAEDNSGNIVAQGSRVSKGFGIDVTQPTIQVSYDNNNAINDRYFNDDRTATVVVTERNFDASATRIDTQSAASISGWVHEHPTEDNANGDKDTWTCTITYDKDGDYTLDIVTVDLAKNSQEGETDYGSSVAPQDFVLDKTVPVINITFDNNDVRNGHYYNAARVATVTITEHNFSANDAQVDVEATILEGTVNAPDVDGWSRNDDTNVGNVTFSADGDYTLRVNYTDLAGNTAEEVVADDFTVDTTAPELEIGGVEDLSANSGVVAPRITYHDINYAAEETRISITGYRNTEGQNLTGRAVEDAVGGSFICDNIEEVPGNDDIYTCTGHVEDMAGNVSEVEIMFSVNRFGSNYILDDATQQLVDGYYTSEAPTIGIREINVDTLEFTEITATYNGEIITLEEGKDYQVQQLGSQASWKEYSYTISPSCFTADGLYNITVHSRDAAQNENSNRTARVEEYAMPVDFVLDTTAPMVVITGVEADAQYMEDERLITVLAEDNIRLKSLALELDGASVATYDAQQLEENGGKLTYNVLSKNDWQTMTVTVTDMAGNTTRTEEVRFLLTTNMLVQYLHNTPAIVATVIGVGCLGFVVFGAIKRRRGAEKTAVR